MNQSPESKEQELFKEAIELPGPTERAAFLEQACRGDSTLRETVELLLEGHFQAEGFLTELPPRSPAAQKKLIVGGKYQLLQKIGEGGFGEIWRTEQLQPVRRSVAVKLLKPGMDTRQIVARFEVERQALALMDHPNIAKVFDAGSTEAGRPYFVMELVHGVKITEYCRQHGLALNKRLQLFILVCQAIQHAHQKGIIHRDIKPSNVLVALQDGVAVPKVIDFGIAKATQQILDDQTVVTQFQQFLGTPAYISPEQALLTGEDVDTRSDIYSLGVLLYELLAGKPPFDSHELLAAGLDEMRRLIQEREPARPSSCALSPSATLDPDLDWITMKCLEKDRTRRYPTANALAADLQHYLDHEPVIARPPSATYRLKKTFRRNRVVFSSVGAIALAILIGAAISFVMFLRAERQRGVAVRATDDLHKHVYVAEMSVAHQALSEGNLARVHRLLEAQPPDLRGFEWRYLWKLAQGDNREALATYSGFIGALAISADNELLALNQENPARLEIIHLPSKTVVRSLPTSHSVGPLRFSPDGAFLLGQSDGRLIRWNLKSWEASEPLPSTFPLAFLADNKTFLAQENDHFSLWNLEDWKKIREIPQAKALPANEAWASQQALAISADGKQFYYLGFRSRIHGWDLTEQKALAPIELDRDALITCLAASSDGLLAISGWDGSVRVFDLKTQAWIAQFSEHLSWVSGLAFLPHSATLVSASADQTIVFYSPRDQTVSGRLRGHDTEIWALAVAPDAKTLITGAGYGGEVLRWTLPEVKSDSARQEALVVRILSDGRLLRYLPDAHDYERYDLASGAATPAGMRRLGDLVRRPIYPSDFQSLAPDWTIVSPDTHWTVSNRGQLLAVAVWNSYSGDRETILTNHVGRVMHACFSDDSAFLALFGQDSEVRVFRTADWSVVAATQPLSGRAEALFTPDSRQLVIASQTAGVFVLDIPSLKTRARFQSSDLTWTSMALSKDGQYFALGGEDNLIRVYDFKNSKALPPLAGHAAGVWGLAFSPDSRTLASTGDKRIKLWSVNTWQELLTLHHGDRNPSGLSFSPDGLHLICYAPFQVWSAPALEEIEALTANRKARRLLH